MVKIFDFHLHLTFKAFNSTTLQSDQLNPPDKDLWRERFRPLKEMSGKSLAKEINTTSQAHLNALASGGFHCVCTSLYPLERVFTEAFKDLDKSVFFHLVRFLADKKQILPFLAKITRPAFFKLVSTATGIKEHTIREINKGDFHYFNELSKEYDFMVQNQHQKPPFASISYALARSFTEVVQIIANSQMAVIHTVEGTNCFMDKSGNFDDYLEKERNGRTGDIIRILKDNITAHKSRDFPPFIITLAHHQYNFLCGHAPSFTGISRIFLKQEGKTTVEGTKQKIEFFDVGIRSWAWEIIELILSRSVGKGRTLIDTKHMSAMARVDYHRFIKNKKSQGDQIPIVKTHSAVNGRPVMNSARGNQLELDEDVTKKSEFFTGSLNLFDDEIRDIVDSDGLIGIMLDEKRILGRTMAPDAAFFTRNLPVEPVVPTTPEMTELQKRENEKPHNRFDFAKRRFQAAQFRLIKNRHELLEEELKGGNGSANKIQRLKTKISEMAPQVDFLRKQLELPSMAILLNQFFHIAKVLNNPKAWDHVCFGSDYEGVIDPLDIFYYADGLENIGDRLVQFWKGCANRPEPEFDKYRALTFGIPVEEIMEKILWGNSQRFLRTYFNEGYLKSV